MTDSTNGTSATNSQGSAPKSPKSIGKGVSNPTTGSCVTCHVNKLEINLFFDGTWNSRYNTDRYNDPYKVHKVQETISRPENQRKTRRPWDDKDRVIAQDILEGRLLGEDYNGSNTSFSRAPTGVDQMARAFSGSERVVALYVDGAGTITPHKVRKDDNPFQRESNEYALVESDFSDDSMIGSGLGMGDSGVYGKLRQMFRKIYNTIQQKSAAMPIDYVSFNVYGFSRGAATARMFVHRILNYDDAAIAKEVDALLNEEERYVNQQPFDRLERDAERSSPALSFRDLLNPIRFRVKIVGLFDTVSSIGFNHDDDVADEKQQLVFSQTNRPLQVIHITAGHEFRQKFSLVSIAEAVRAGCGFEIVLPGCHTDIGDGLDTEWKRDDEANPETGQRDWNLKHVEDQVTICQKYNPLSLPFMGLTKLKLFSPISLSRVVQGEEKALLNLQRACFKTIIRDLTAQGWFVEDLENPKRNEIWLDDDVLTMEKIKVHRNFKENSKSGIESISPNYPKVATKIMFDILKDMGEDTHYDFKKYDIESFGEAGVGMLKNLADDLIGQAKAKYQDYKTNKAQYFIPSDLINHEQQQLSCYIDIADTDLRKVLYHDYLHWCSVMKRSLLDLIFTHVSIPQINPQTNRFYRTVHQG